MPHRTQWSWCVFHGFLPPSPEECCHPVQRISATQSTVCCHPRSVATLDCMISLCALLLSMASWRSPLRHPVSPRCYRGSRGVHHRCTDPQESQAAPHRVGCDGATRRWAGLPYIAGACLGTVACRLRIESPCKAIL